MAAPVFAKQTNGRRTGRPGVMAVLLNKEQRDFQWFQKFFCLTNGLRERKMHPYLNMTTAMMERSSKDAHPQ